MNLAIFDIDGTLTRTVAVDSECYALAFAETHGLRGIDTDWSTYRHSTDTGIAIELLERHLTRPATSADVDIARDRFVALLQQAHSLAPEQFGPTPGASAALQAIGASTQWRAAIATGGWQPSARFKLRVAGLEVGDLPAAFADDAHARADIVRTAIARAQSAHRVQQFERIVYIGDAPWDVQAAGEVGIGFVGIGEGDRAARLMRHGAKIVLPHFEPPESFLQLLERLTAPSP